MHPSTASRKDGKNLASIIEFCVSQKRPSKEGFDIVIGNPPYGANYSVYMNLFLQNNITIVTTQDSRLIISCLWVTIGAFSIVT